MGIIWDIMGHITLWDIWPHWRYYIIILYLGTFSSWDISQHGTYHIKGLYNELHSTLLQWQINAKITFLDDVRSE